MAAIFNILKCEGRTLQNGAKETTTSFLSMVSIKSQSVAKCRRVSQNVGLLHSVKLCDRAFPLVAVCCRSLAPWFNGNNTTCPQLKWYQMTLLFWGHSWSHNFGTDVSIDRRASQDLSKAVSIRRNVLQNQNSATLCDTCDLIETRLKTASSKFSYHQICRGSRILCLS